MNTNTSNQNLPNSVQKPAKVLRPHQFYHLAHEFSTKDEFESWWQNGAAKGWSKSTIYTRKDGNLIENFRCSPRLCKNMLRVIYLMDSELVQVECTFDGKHEDYHGEKKHRALNTVTKAKIKEMCASGRKARWIYFHLVQEFGTDKSPNLQQVRNYLNNLRTKTRSEREQSNNSFGVMEQRSIEDVNVSDEESGNEDQDQGSSSTFNSFQNSNNPYFKNNSVDKTYDNFSWLAPQLNSTDNHSLTVHESIESHADSNFDGPPNYDTLMRNMVEDIDDEQLKQFLDKSVDNALPKRPNQQWENAGTSNNNKEEQATINGTEVKNDEETNFAIFIAKRLQTFETRKRRILEHKIHSLLLKAELDEKFFDDFSVN